MKLYLIIFGILFIAFPAVRCVTFHPFSISGYSVFDTLDYVIHRKWKDFNEYGIDMYVGMFGHGKTLSMTHRARQLYKKFGNSIRFVSNYKLIGIPYVPLKNFNQLLELGEDEEPYYTQEEVQERKLPPWYYDEDGKVLPEYIEDLTIEQEEKEGEEPKPIVIQKVRRWKYQGTVVLIDEIEDVLSHRNYANFPLPLLNMLTQQRKKKVKIMCSAQRFFMVDKVFRTITTHVVDCNKYWRLQGMKYYDAWDYENAMTPQLVKCQKVRYWFVRNKDYKSYSTEQMISKTMSEDFISNDLHLARLGLDNVVNEQAVQRPSRKLRKQRKARGK